MQTRPIDGGVTASIWTADAEQRRYETPPPHETEVCIVGAGIAGLSTALALARQGVRVTVLDDGPIGGGETGRTSAHLASALDDRYHVLERQFGKRGAQRIAESHAAAIDWIEATIDELGIACDFQRVDGYLFAPPGDRDPRAERQLAQEYDAARRAGLAVDRVERAPLPFESGPALRFARQAELHPLRYLRGLAAGVVARGGSIHTGVHVEAIEPGQPLSIRFAGGGAMVCRVAVDATNAAITSKYKFPVIQAAYRTYCLAFEIPRGAIPHALYWDTAEPYHYLRVAPAPSGATSGATSADHELLIVGGADHRTGQGDPMRAWGELEQWTRRWIPVAGRLAVRWSGQVLEPPDGIAHIGRSPELDHVYVVTGDSGNGLTHGTIAALLLPELMRGHRHPWASVYAPNRSHLHALGTLVREAAHSAAPYSEWLRSGEVRSVDALAPGEGALLRRGFHFVAAFRDAAGECHLRSATCPHLRGVVRWNAAEQTWDCPCHGSRFDPYGRVLNGPATVGLAPVELASVEPSVGEPARTPPDQPAGTRERERGPGRGRARSRERESRRS